MQNAVPKGLGGMYSIRIKRELIEKILNENQKIIVKLQ